MPEAVVMLAEAMPEAAAMIAEAVATATAAAAAAAAATAAAATTTAEEAALPAAAPAIQAIEEQLLQLQHISQQSPSQLQQQSYVQSYHIVKVGKKAIRGHQSLQQSGSNCKEESCTSD
jgi:hypothetical protein